MSKRSLVFFLICVFSFVTILATIFNDNLDSRYDLLFFIPSSFLFASLINYRIHRYYLNNLVVSIIFTTYFIRNVIAIYVLSSNDYFSILDNFSLNDMNSAIMIMSLDIIFVFCYLNYEMKYHFNKYKKKSLSYNELFNDRNSRLFKFSTLIILFFICLSWLIVPEISENFVTLFDVDFAELSSIETNGKIERGGFKRLLLTLSLMFIKILRIILPIFFIIWMKLNFKYILIRILFFFTVLFLQFLLISSQTMDVILVLLVLFLVFLKIENNSTFFFSIGSISSLAIIIFLFYAKMDVYTDLGTALSLFLQSYFPGVYNLANVFSIETDISKFHSLFSDFYTMIPFRNSVFGIEVDLNTSEIYNARNTIKGQIIPFIGEAFYYLGYLAFIIPILIIKGAFYYYSKANKTTNIFEFTVYTYVTIFFAISPILYHDTILGAFFFTTVIPLSILLKFNNIYFKKI